MTKEAKHQLRRAELGLGSGAAGAAAAGGGASSTRAEGGRLAPAPARAEPAGEAVAAWTAKAMGGSVPFEEALAARLELIKPSQSDIAACLAAHPPQLNAGVAEMIELLHARGTAVYLVSGGFRLMINPVADMLSISHDRVYANTILFDGDGGYAGFDATEPTSADGGKPKVIGALKDRLAPHCTPSTGEGDDDDAPAIDDGCVDERDDLR